MRRSEQLGIVVERDAYSQGYWMCFDGQPRPTGWRARQGWDECDQELRFEAGGVVAEPEESPLICPQWAWA